MSLTHVNIAAVHLQFDLVEPQDAEYIHGLRMDTSLNTHLSTVTGSIADQATWIAKYKSREAEGREYYFVIRRRDDHRRCGVVRLYEINGDHFTWGSWILDGAKPPKAALESAMLVYDVGFRHLGRAKAVFDVRNENIGVLAFHRRFGATKTGRDTQDTFFEYHATQFAAARDGFLGILRGAQEAQV